MLYGYNSSKLLSLLSHRAWPFVHLTLSVVHEHGTQYTVTYTVHGTDGPVPKKYAVGDQGFPCGPFSLLHGVLSRS